MSLWRDARVKLLRGITVKREFRGRFTGKLSVGHAFVARTLDGLGTYAHEDWVRAAKGALSLGRSSRTHSALDARALSAFRSEVHELLLKRLDGAHGFPVDHLVSFDPYQTLLPRHRAHWLAQYKGRTVPLTVIEKVSADAVLHMDRKDIADLLYQLDCDVLDIRSSVAGTHAPRPAPRRSLTCEEEDALQQFVDA